MSSTYEVFDTSHGDTSHGGDPFVIGSVLPTYEICDTSQLSAGNSSVD